MHVSGLYIYPIKGCRGAEVDRATVESWGLAGDRRWMLIDEAGRYVSQRARPELARVTARLTSGGVEASADGMEPLAVKEPEQPDALVPVRVWSGDMEAVAAGPEAHEWFSEYLSAPVRLVWLDDPHRRPLDPEYGVRTAFSDSFPLLVTTEASLDALNDWLVEAGEDPVPMNRFRPNLVVSGAEPWAEDTWTGLRFADGMELRSTKPCTRCVVTTTDQQTGERRGREPLRTLARRRRFDAARLAGSGGEASSPGAEASASVGKARGGGAVFGMNMALAAGWTGPSVGRALAVGDTVQPVQRPSG